MTYVYILQSIEKPGHHYVGVTADLRARIKKHNAREVSYSSKYAPWEIKDLYRIRRREAGSCIREVSQVSVR
jgi:predicted GIY-YIG superfamily endonuclease